MIFVYLAALIAAGGVIWLAIGIWKIGKVSTGTPIGPRSRSALMLIDLQTVFWDSDIYPHQERATAQAAILKRIEQARASDTPVIAIRQEWSIPSTKALARLMMKGRALAGTAGTEIAPPFADLADHTLIKRVQDAFETGELDNLLRDLDVGSVQIAGLDGNYCVAKTALAAAQRGYDVTIVQDGVLTAGRAQFEKTLTGPRGAGIKLV